MTDEQVKERPKSDSLGDRMKRNYENTSRTVLPMRMPTVVRLDGKAFHTWTKRFKRPFDENFMAMMDIVAVKLCTEMQGAELAYVQSDEISVFLHNYKRLDTTAWFDNSVQKIVSVAASIAGAAMTAEAARMAFFEARVFVLPESELGNYFIWRQQDATRNSIQMVAQALYSQTELHGKNTNELQDMIHAKGQNWNDLPVSQKRGRCIKRRYFEVEGVERSEWFVDEEPPIFSQDRDYIEKHLAVVPEDPKPMSRF